MSTIAIEDLYAKSDKRLLDHMIETGTIAEGLLAYGRAHSALIALEERFSITESEFVSFIAFLCALHDIGKAHPGFQKDLSETCNGKVNQAVSKLIEGGMIDNVHDEHIRHERYSMEILNDWLITHRELSKMSAEIYSSVLAYHHQGKSKDISIEKPVKKFDHTNDRWCKWQNVQMEMLQIIESKWQWSNSILEHFCDISGGKEGINGLMYFILSVMVTADWIASGSIWDRYLSVNSSLDIAAKRFIEDNNLLYKPLKQVFSNVTWERVFSFEKNDMQSVVSDEVKPGTGFLLIEAPCGCGKTEAALLAALKMGYSKSGVYFAMPTTSTAKGLTGRMQDLISKIDTTIIIPELDSSMVWSDDDMSKIPQDLWTSKTRHQLLYPFAVGTVDQILKTVLYYRYSCIGILGISDKVIVVDEVHAYDAYMLEELECLIKWCRFFDVPVILLSATLPQKTKAKLFKAAGISNQHMSQDYPLISKIESKNLEQIHVSIPNKSISIKCETTNDFIESVADKVLTFDEGCIACVTGTVDEAFELYDRLLKDNPEDELFLYVGRSTVSINSRKVKELLGTIGKDRTNRPQRLIVVATSIIEQSLDVDFDYMITKVAPVDLLIQRMGRVWRHSDKGTIREKIKIGTPIEILVPEKYDVIEKIYGKEWLDATAGVLLERTSIDVISDIRDLIDTVYSADLSDEIKKALRSGERVINKPFNDMPIIVKRDEAQYRKFDGLLPVTRESDFKTQTICILPVLKDEYTYDEMKEIMLSNVIHSVSEYKLKGFVSAKTDIKWFDDVLVYIDERMLISCDNRSMVLTKDGLRFDKSSEIEE